MGAHSVANNFNRVEFDTFFIFSSLFFIPAPVYTRVNSGGNLLIASMVAYWEIPFCKGMKKGEKLLL